MKGHVDVAKLKAKAAADGEAFILESVRKLNKELEGKYPPPPFFIFCLHDVGFSLWLMSIPSLL